MNEKDLIRALKTEDAHAFSQLYDAYFQQVYNFTKLYICSCMEVSEIVQDVFVKVWETRHTIDENKSFEGFLFIITRNLIFNYNRRHLNELNFKVTALRALEQSYNIDEELEADDLKQFISSLITHLPPQRQKIFRLSREKKMSNKEIAEHCSITEKAVERQMTLALKFLRENIPLFILFYSCMAFHAPLVKSGIFTGSLPLSTDISLNSVMHDHSTAS